jgi:hypothetical protein
VLKDFYLIGLWSYCEGENTNGTAKITYCSSPTGWFWFNPTDAWGLKNTFVQNVLGDNLQTGLNSYRKVMRWMVCSIVLASVSTAVEILVSFFALRSKVASLVTWIIWGVRSTPTFSKLLTLISPRRRPFWQSQRRRLPQWSIVHYLASSVQLLSHTISVFPWVVTCSSSCGLVSLLGSHLARYGSLASAARRSIILQFFANIAVRLCHGGS